VVLYRAGRLLVVPVFAVTPWRVVRGGGLTASLTGGNEMDAVKIAAIILIVAGILGLVYGSFSYTKETHKATIGPIDLAVK